ncbi:MAG TPA: cytidine deaminase, partial [Stackebrandtia sp.]|uniref:cytidine deaminase n=1 Tax=Stackebrandtia sp. TaxID=2023065 RepID=UPI002D4CA026
MKDAEDDKLVTLARAAAARVGATSGAAVRDDDGRTYASAAVSLPSLKLSGLQAAVAQAAAAGATALEAAVLVSLGDDPDGLAAVRDLTPQTPVYRVNG